MWQWKHIHLLHKTGIVGHIGGPVEKCVLQLELRSILCILDAKFFVAMAYRRNCLMRRPAAYIDIDLCINLGLGYTLQPGIALVCKTLRL